MVLRAQAEVDVLLVQNPELERKVDRLGETIQGVVRDFFTKGGPERLRLRHFLNGVWLGHPVHAAVTDLPIGAWTAAQLFDYVGALTGSKLFKSAGDLVTAAGILGGFAAAATGLADYSEISDEQRRYGTIHGMLNAVGLTVMTWSLLRRLAGDRAGALPLSTFGYLLSVVSADLGGAMVYRYGTAVSRQAFSKGPTEYTRVLATEKLGEGELRAVKAHGAEVVLARVGGTIFAIGNTCTHLGCPLAEGKLADGTITCGCHGSQFALDSGAVRAGPATGAEPTYDVRVVDGQIEIRRRPHF